MGQPFFPPDKPKSFATLISSLLMALLVFGPFIGLGAWLNLQWLFRLGYFGFAACWLVGFASAAFLAIGTASGRYKNIKSRKWRDQIW